MEPNKFEENIRTKLEEREIQPTPQAWGKLEAQLGEPKTSNKTLWYSIAASLVAILVVGSFLLKEDKTVSKEIVEQANPTEIEENSTSPIFKDGPEENTVVAEESTEEEEKELLEKTMQQNKGELATATSETSTEKKLETKENTRIKTAETSVATSEASEVKENPEAPKATQYFDKKVEEVVASVESLQQKNTQVTIEEVENLLQQAQRDIATQRLLDQATTRIDPASLLDDVENELERSFRDKVFDALGEGFNKIRTAVVERNN